MDWLKNIGDVLSVVALALPTPINLIVLGVGVALRAVSAGGPPVKS
jgi:hypothetical protein